MCPGFESLGFSFTGWILFPESGIQIYGLDFEPEALNSEASVWNSVLRSAGGSLGPGIQSYGLASAFGAWRRFLELGEGAGLQDLDSDLPVCKLKLTCCRVVMWTVTGVIASPSLRKSGSPDGAKQNPGATCRVRAKSRIPLRSIRATTLYYQELLTKRPNGPTEQSPGLRP